MIRRGDDAVVGEMSLDIAPAQEEQEVQAGGGGGDGRDVAQNCGVTLAQSGHLVQPLLGMCIGQKPKVQKLGVWKLDTLMHFDENCQSHYLAIQALPAFTKLDHRVREPYM